MRILVSAVFLAASMVALQNKAWADVMELTPMADNTLFEDPEGDFPGDRCTLPSVHKDFQAQDRFFGSWDCSAAYPPFVRCGPVLSRRRVDFACLLHC